MKKMFACSLAFIMAMLINVATVSAENCPVKHPALTSLDHASMLAAYTASFKGIYGRNPTGVTGSGLDDANYWIGVSDHYGEFGDNVCRAGWSAYWEQKLTGQDAVDPKLGDQPARFQPESGGNVPNPPTPPTPPAPVFDDAALRKAIADVKAELDELVRANGEAHASINQNVSDGRAENRSAWAAVAQHWKAITAIVSPVISWYVAKRTAQPEHP